MNLTPYTVRADLHVSDDAGVRAIHAAADRGHTRMCALLMDRGAEKVID